MLNFNVAEHLKLALPTTFSTRPPHHFGPPFLHRLWMLQLQKP